MREDLNKGTDILCLYFVRFNTMKKSILPKKFTDSQIQFNLYPISMRWFFQKWKSWFSNSDGIAKNTEYPNHPLKEEKSRKIHISEFQSALQGYSNQNSVVLA